MDEPRVDELLHRIQGLEREKRRWKVIGMSSLLALTLLLFLGCGLSVGTALLVRVRYARAMAAERQAVEEAREAEERARREAERREKQAEQDKHQAEKDSLAPKKDETP